MTDRQNPRSIFRYADSYLTVDPALAQAIGLDEAIVLTRVSYLLHQSRNKSGHLDERGTVWVWNSYEEWRSDHFPFFTKSHVTEVIRRLEREGLLVSRQRTSHDRRKLYTIDYDAVDKLVGATMTPEGTGRGQGDASASGAKRGKDDDPASQDGRGHGESSATAKGRGEVDAPGIPEKRAHRTTEAHPMNPEKRARQPTEARPMNAEKPGGHGGEAPPPCARNRRMQGRGDMRSYRDTRQQTRRQEDLSAREVLLRDFRVSERYAYVQDTV